MKDAGLRTPVHDPLPLVLSTSIIIVELSVEESADTYVSKRKHSSTDIIDSSLIPLIHR